MSVRQLAVKILEDLVIRRRSLAELGDEIRKISNQHDRSYIQALCYGMARFYWQVEGVARELIKTPLKEKDQDVHLLILVGLYELIHMRTPDHAVVSNVVDAVRELGKPKLAGLVNAVLRSFLRDKKRLLEKAEKNPVARFSHPKWLLTRLQEAWPNDWMAMVKANNEHPPMMLRINEQLISQEEYLVKLSAVGIAAKPSAFSTVGVELLQPVSVQELPGFSSGEVFVQGISAQLAVPLLDLKPGQMVLDACAAPGGKTCHILQAEPALKKVIAVESSSNRMHLIRENLERAQLRADCVCADVAKIDTWWDGVMFDRILLDAPCSSTGVIRRHPDIKLLRRDSDIEKLAKKQYEILVSLWKTLKPGGRLVYVTCSVLPEECVDVVSKFLEEHQDAEEKIITMNVGVAQKYGRQILTGQHNMDGFYYAVLMKH